jgi:hypothetical protein
MPEVIQKQIVTDATTTGAKTAFDVRNVTSWSVYVTSTGGTSASFQVEGTNDPAGATGFAALAMRQQGGGAYATTAIANAAGATKSVYFDPADNVCWVRVNVTANTGPTTVNAYLTGEL